MMPITLPTLDVIPAQAGIHVRQYPGTLWSGEASRMDSGLRRNDPVGGMDMVRDRTTMPQSTPSSIKGEVPSGAVTRSDVTRRSIEARP